MCGIFGSVDSSSPTVRAVPDRGCLDSLVCRGPDDAGWWQNEGAVLGHTRLSIMDLSEAGRQPMGNEDGSVWITFNGEIYRFWELREELERAGHVFASTCDTEVILHGYEEWGLDVLRRIDGMFASRY